VYCTTPYPFRMVPEILITFLALIVYMNACTHRDLEQVRTSAASRSEIITGLFSCLTNRKSFCLTKEREKS
jgi:hypothetical protein